MRIYVYTNNTQIRATLTHTLNGNQNIIKETHVFLNQQEQTYDSKRKEGLAISHALVDFFHYIENVYFTIISHNPEIMELNWANYERQTNLRFDVQFIPLPTN